MAPKLTTVEQILARLATRAHGVVTRRELLNAGITAAEIKHRIRKGALLPVYRGVYRVGHEAPSVESRYMAAVKACGDEGLLRGVAAAHVHGLLRGKAPPPPEVVAPTDRRKRGFRTKHSRRMDARHATRVRGIPITTVARTLVDLAGELTEDDLARAFHEANVRYRTTPAQVERVLERRPMSPGAAKLRRVLRGDTHVTLSRLEGRFLARLRAARLPLPVTNRLIDEKRVDCRWPAQRLTVELDSYRFHGTRHAWEQDLRRERQAHARGDEFRRYTHGDVFEDPRYMIDELESLLKGRPDIESERTPLVG